MAGEAQRSVEDFVIERLERALDHGFAVQGYFDWQIQPEMDVPTLTSNPRYQTLNRRVGDRVTKLNELLQSSNTSRVMPVRQTFPF